MTEPRRAWRDVVSWVAYAALVVFAFIGALAVGFGLGLLIFTLGGHR